jgi:hypothetical protein
MHSYPNKSSGGNEDKGGRLKIKDFPNPKPPPGASNSYEKVSEKIYKHDERSLSRDHYTREKMANK